MTLSDDGFQRDFIRAIYDDRHDHRDHHADQTQESSALQALTSQPGFKVYRNTVLKASVDALAANYPSIERLVGQEWFRAAALVYARATPPRSVCLIEYGDDFADFLAQFAPAAQLPYLADVAHLDRAWTECHIGADEAALDGEMLSALPQDGLLSSVLPLRAAVRWRWSAEHPAYAIWDANRRPDSVGRSDGVEDSIAWQGDGALLSRIDGEVCWQPASIATCAFLEACAGQGDLHSAVTAALQVEPAADIAALLSTLIQAQAFKAPEAPFTR